MMRIFDSVEVFALRSENVLSVFHKTLKKLELINTQIDVRTLDTQKEIEERNRQLEVLQQTRVKNQKVINNITNLIKTEDEK